jgi:hypothetical protein
MASDRLFLDTAFVVALLNPKDALHEKAKSQFDAVKKAREVWTTEAVLFEIGNAFGLRTATHKGSGLRFCKATCRILTRLRVYFCIHTAKGNNLRMARVGYTS